MHIQRNTLLSIVSHTSLVTEEVERYNENTRSNPIDMVGFSVTGQVDTARRSSLSPDTMTLLVFLYESLSLDRKIRSSRIVRTALED